MISGLMLTALEFYTTQILSIYGNADHQYVPVDMYLYFQWHTPIISKYKR